MRFTLLAPLIALALGAQALAQPAVPTTPAGKPVNPTGTAANTSATATALRVGQSVVDSTGLTIGKLSELKADPAGKPMATIQLGTGPETVTVEADRLTIRGQVASINATQAELKATAAKKPPV